MRRWWPSAAAVFAAAVLQVGLAPHLAVAGIVPNLLLLLVITLALVEGPNPGAVIGFACGVVLDLLGAGPIGTWALVLSVVGFVAGMLQANLFAEGWLLPVTVVFVASLFAEFSYGLVLGIVGVGDPFWRSFVRVMLPGAAYATVLAVLIYPWLARVLRKEPSVQMVKRLL